MAIGTDYIEIPRPLIQDKTGYLLVKRTLDVMASVALLVLLAIPMAAIALLVRLDSPGPALFRQERLGKGGRPFTIYKYRSMRLDAESEGPQWADRDDSRCTRLGRMLRKTRLDELPQLWNILIGGTVKNLAHFPTAPRPALRCGYPSSSVTSR